MESNAREFYKLFPGITLMRVVELRSRSSAHRPSAWISRQLILLPQAVGDILQPGVGISHRLFPVRVNQAAGGRGDEALGQKLVPVDAGFRQEGPQVL